LTETVPAHTSFLGPTAPGGSAGRRVGEDSSARGATCTKEEEVPAATGTGPGSVQSPFTGRVQSPLPAALAIENTLGSRPGPALTCTVVNPTASELQTTKAIATVNGTAADATTQIPPGAEVAYQIATTIHGGPVGKPTLTETVPAHTSFLGPTAPG